MLLGKTTRMNKHQTTRTNSKNLLAHACLGFASIFLAAVFMSGCVVHHPGHGLLKRGHGHHKTKLKIVPKAEISVSPLIVIGD